MPAYGVGVDYSTHKVHMALVAQDKLLEQRVVPFDGKTGPERLTLLMLAFHEMRRELPGHVVIEEPFVAAHENVRTPIVLGKVVGFIEAAAYMEGFTVQTMTANEWRSFAGIMHGKRADLKRRAIALYSLQFHAKPRDDNEAEAALMALVACRQGRIDELVQAAKHGPRHGRPKAWMRQQLDEEVPA